MTLKIVVRIVTTGLTRNVAMLVSILIHCQPSAKRSVRGKPRPLPLLFQGVSLLCLSPCVTYHPQCVQM